MHSKVRKLGIGSWAVFVLITVVTLGAARLLSTLILVLALSVLIAATFRTASGQLLKLGIALMAAAFFTSLLPVDLLVRQGKQWHVSFPRVYSGGAAAKLARSKTLDGYLEGEDYIVASNRGFLVPVVRCILFTYP